MKTAIERKPPKKGITIKTGNPKLDKSITRMARLVVWLKAVPVVAHLLRAVARFNDRLGSQFGAAITYFSFLSLIPVLMLSFALVGTILASNEALLSSLIGKIVASISDPVLSQTLENTVNTAIKQRTAVGVTGLLLALYSGISWMGNLREAIRAQFRDQWERGKADKEKWWKRYLRDLISLGGLVIALFITLSLTTLASTARTQVVYALGLEGVVWLSPLLAAITLVISIAANYLLFLWLFWILPRHKPRRRALLRGSLLAAVGFEIIKFIMALTLPQLARSPSGAAFGSVLGLMAFFYFFARLILFCAAWIATAQYPEDGLEETSAS